VWVLSLAACSSNSFGAGKEAGIICSTTPTNRAVAAVTTPNSEYFGANAHFVWQGACFQDKSIDLMQEAGIQTVRFDLPWNVLEPRKGNFDRTALARLDHAVDALVARHIEPIAVVGFAPSWASGSNHSTAPPRSNQDYDDYLGFWIKRWAGQVKAYEIWNEPNYDWYPKADPVRYTDLLKSAYTYAKKSDPSLTILAGSLTGSDGDKKTGPQWFLQQMYAHGAKKYFDVLSQHGYSYPLNANSPQSVFDMFKAKMLPIMQGAGDGDKQIWWTENGYSTGGAYSVSESAQAAYLVEAYQEAKATVPTIGRLYYYEWTNDRPTVDAEGKVMSANVQDYFGLIDPFSEPNPWRLKPAYTAFKRQPKS
jgi:exo-beta-1,3-glucanase (GH17 family)